MIKIRELAEKVLFSTTFSYVSSGVLIACATVVGGITAYQIINPPTPNQPTYRDVNNDGVEDKIIQRRVKKSGFLGITSYSLEETVLFGVDVNGKRLYLTNDSEYFEQAK